MKKILMMFGVMLVGMMASATDPLPSGGPYKETVDGVEWTFMVDADLHASVGRGVYGSLAIPQSTTGAIAIPEKLGGRTVTSIGDYAFWYCLHLTNVTIPLGVTNIGTAAFQLCSSLTSVTIPSSVVTIGVASFQLCSSLTSVTIPSGVTSIERCAFYECTGLTSVTMPSSVTSIGEQVFYRCDKLMAINVDVNNETYASQDGVLFDAGKKVLIQYPCGKEGAYIVPSGVTSIGNYAFYECSGLTSVTIPLGVTSIGHYAFYDCAMLQQVSIPATVTEISGTAFLGTAFWEQYSGRLVVINSMLLGYSGTCPSEIDIPVGITKICSGAFSSKGISKVTFPTTLVSIADEAFYQCHIQALNLPSGLKYIGKNAFDGNHYSTSSSYKYGYLRSVQIEDVCDLVIDEKAFYGQPVTNVRISGTNITIGASAFASSDYWRAYDTKDWRATVSLIGSKIRIGDKSFYDMSYRSVALDLSGVSSIGSEAFYKLGLYYRSSSSDWYERGESTILFPTTIDSVATNAFSGVCLSCINVPSTEFLLRDDLLQSINPFYCFWYETMVGEGTGNRRLEEVSIPSGITKIPDNAFLGMWLRSVTIPASVNSVGEYAFAYNAFMTNMVFLGDAPDVGQDAFAQNGKIKNIFNTCVVTVMEGTKGWDDDEDGKWCGFTLRYLNRVEYNVNSYDGNYDGKGHGITINVYSPAEGSTVVYSLTKDGAYSSEPTLFTNVTDGAQSVYYKIFADGFLPIEGMSTVTIAPASEGGPYTETVEGVEWTFKVDANLSARVDGISSSAKGAVTVPSTLGGRSVTSVGYEAFYRCAGLTSVIIPSSVVSIGTRAFAVCTGLTSVTIPSSVTSIGEYAFYWCDNLTAINVDANNEIYASQDGVLFDIGKTVLVQYPCGEKGAYTIPSSVTAVGGGAFAGCTGLTRVTIHEGVTSIGNVAFSNCSGLMSVTIPSSVTSIGIQAFAGCASLTSVIIPSSVTSIGEDAFYNCNAICEATVPGWKCGINFSSVTNLVIAKGTTSIGYSAFSSCFALMSVTIPSSVTSIGNYAFRYCDNLNIIDFEGAPPSGVVNASIKQDAGIRYNVAYETQWLPVIQQCGWTNAQPYTPSVEPGGEIVVPEGKAEGKATEINSDPAVKAQYLKAPGGVETTADYLGCFSAVATSGSTVEFVLNEEGTNEVLKATDTIKTTTLDVVLSVGTTVTIDEPLVGFYYSLKQGANVSVSDQSDLNKLGGRDLISFELTKGPLQYFYQTIVSPTPLTAE